jgi:hypothetical protein
MTYHEEGDLRGRADGDPHRDIHLAAHGKYDSSCVLRSVADNRQQDRTNKQRWNAERFSRRLHSTCGMTGEEGGRKVMKGRFCRFRVGSGVRFAGS